MSSGVEFDEDSFSYSAKPRVPGSVQGSQPNDYGGVPGYNTSNSNPHGMAGFLIRHGLAKSNNSAQIVLVAVVVLNIIITFIVIRYFL
jgi:hypothetical protein